MQGLRKYQPARRSASRVALFDPSSNEYCTGWWRADSGLSKDSHNYVTGWTSRLPSGLTMGMPYASNPIIYVPECINGFPAILASYSPSMLGTSGCFHDGDIDFTITTVFRLPSYFESGSQVLIYVDTTGCGIAMVGNYGPHLSLHVRNNYCTLNNTWTNGTFTPQIVTARFFNTDWGMSSSLHQNGVYIGGWTNNGGVSLNTSTNIYCPYSTLQPIFFSELIVHRIKLTDSEVQDMQNTLMAQYGVGL
jgi:hypothetical protein